ncbi:SnoaL-like domain-containing protein [Nonlabens sp. Hel1_33_55]|uniref:nuclear transport factor 2 family protein n=1 Tax=Nonlabens sp. Hel1_33_55 TaxID=1336802 RepID=UPI000875CFCC|nr:nuclear transport factor 2 family protein [Nonlabens sp. Hel1_33_55]SCY07660.1 SnoaL-like domain-containing protein [Nonlabens sp. Hel1_33_55]
MFQMHFFYTVMDTKTLLTQFYKGLKNANASNMTALYKDNSHFKDPVFGDLHGEHAISMWHMLFSKNNQVKISYKIIEATPTYGKVQWTANYLNGSNKRPVTNHVTANFKLADGEIVNHVDSFNLSKWSRQALGVSGLLMGWSSFMKNQIQKKTNSLLDHYIELKR